MTKYPVAAFSGSALLVAAVPMAVAQEPAAQEPLSD
jgi:hypothetical protein